jgi:hypothetical protein
MIALSGRPSAPSPVASSTENSAAPEPTTAARAASSVMRDASSAPLVMTTTFGWRLDRVGNRLVALRSPSQVARPPSLGATMASMAVVSCSTSSVKPVSTTTASLKLTMAISSPAGRPSAMEVKPFFTAVRPPPSSIDPERSTA